MSIQRLSLTGLLILALLAPGASQSLAQPAATPATASDFSLAVENASRWPDVAAHSADSGTVPDAPSDEHWAEGFNFPGIDGAIRALALGPDGSLYAGGRFGLMGTIPTNRIARWDGVRWHPLGSGIRGLGVSALAFGPDGMLYAAGEFAIAGGVVANHIARWDGSQWHPLGAGMDRYGVYALAFGPDGSLYAGGSFNNAGGAAAAGIARWDGAQWHPLGSGVSHDVNALAFSSDGSLYAGGRFTTAGGVAANYIARWDGAQWHPLGSGIGGDYPSVRALAFGPDGSLYAGGEFTTVGGAAANRIARWDGSQWHPLGSGMNHGVYALRFGADGSLYVGGNFTTAGGAAANYIARWDGSQWRALSSGVDGWVGVLAFGPGGLLYAGGNFIQAGGTYSPRIARWDGAQWHAVFVFDGNGMNGEVMALAAESGGSVYAAGNFTAAGGVAANRIARWDGSQWHPLGSGITGITYGCRYALVVGPDGSLYAGGCFNEVGGVAANGVARWDGAQWHPLGSGMGGSGPEGVFALAFGPDGSLYAGGYFANAGGVSASNIARWDGSQWHPLGSGVNSYVYALAFGPDGSLFACGYFTYAGGIAANRIARWDGSQWHPLGSGMDGALRVEALVVGSGGSLYAGGDFTTAGGIAANNIARWDGSQWHPLGSGIGGYYPSVRALAFGPSGSLYAGGFFTAAGSVPANDVARWDGAQWHPLGSGVNYSVNALALSSDGSLYAGGDFNYAGGKPSSRIARWTGEGAFTYAPNVLAPIEQPTAGAFVSGAVTLRGYAIDRGSVAGTGIDAIHIYLDGPYGTGTIIGGATYGLDRPDIAAQYGARFGPSGWELAWDTAGLAPGAHRLYLYAHRTTDNAWSLMEPHLVIVPGGPARWLPIVLRQR